MSKELLIAVSGFFYFFRENKELLPQVENPLSVIFLLTFFYKKNHITNMINIIIPYNNI